MADYCSPNHPLAKQAKTSVAGFLYASHGIHLALCAENMMEQQLLAAYGFGMLMALGLASSQRFGDHFRNLVPPTTRALRFVRIALETFGVLAPVALLAFYIFTMHLLVSYAAATLLTAIILMTHRWSGVEPKRAINEGAA